MGALPSERDKQDGYKKRTYIPHPKKLFPEAGRVSAWRFHASRAADVYLQIWRPLGSLKYQLVGQTLTTTVVGYTELSLGVYDTIAFQKGDTVGFAFPNINPFPYTQLQCINSSYHLDHYDSTLSTISDTFTSKPQSVCRLYSVAAVYRDKGKDNTNSAKKLILFVYFTQL